MPRTIVPIGQEPENKQANAQAEQEGKRLAGSASLDTEVITAEEIENLTAEFTRNGKNALVINPNLANRIRQYLEQQEELEPLMEKLVMKWCKRYQEDGTDGDDVWLSVNGKIIGEIELFYGKKSRIYQIVTLMGFKNFLSYVGHPYAKWIPVHSSGINLATYVFEQGGTFILYGSNKTLEITI